MQALSDHAARFLLWMSQSTLQAGVLICLILLVRHVAGKRLPARWHYALWLLVCLRILAPWAPESQLSLHQILPDLSLNAPVELAGGPTQLGVKGEPPTAPVSSHDPSPNGSEELDIRPAQTAEPASPASAHDPMQVWLFWGLGTLWLLGALLLAGRMIWDHQRLWQIVRRERMLTERSVLELIEDCRERLGMSTMVCVVSTRAIKSPALFGFIRPRLLLPQGLTQSFSRHQLRHVFLHELAHLRRHDIAVNWIVAVCQILHWFNPLVWIGFHLMRADREMACDHVALSHLQPTQSKHYGLTIIRLLEHHAHKHRLASLASISQDPSQLKRRIRTIAQFRSYAERLQIGPILIMVLLTIMGLTNAQSPQIDATWANRSIAAPLYTPPVSPPAPEAALEAMPLLGSKRQIEEHTPATAIGKKAMDSGVVHEEPMLRSDLRKEESPPLAQVQAEAPGVAPSDGNTPAPAWGVRGRGSAAPDGRSSHEASRRQIQMQMQRQGRFSGGQSQQSNQGFVKMFGGNGNINGSVLGVLNARELGLGRARKSSAIMLQGQVPPTWPAFAWQVEYRLLQINHMMQRSSNGARRFIGRSNLAFLIHLSNCLCAALNAHPSVHAAHDQGSPPVQDKYIQRLQRSLASTVADPAQLLLVKKHCLRMNQISQRLYNALEGDVRPVPKRLHQTLLEEWATLRSSMQGTEIQP